MSRAAGSAVGQPVRLARLSPQFGCKTEGVIGQWDVPVWGGIHECVQTGNSNSLVSPQKFALDLVIDDCRHENASASTKTVLEPVCYCDDFTAALWLRYQAERTGIEEKNVAHG
jgi:hypothetical protein